MKKIIKIGLINSNSEPYPLPYGLINGGIFITGILADRLSVDKNFKVTFFTASDSKSKSNIESFGIDSYFKFSQQKILKEPIYSMQDRKIILLREQELFTRAIKFANDGNLDLLNVHNNFYSVASLFSLSNVPILYTCHDPTGEYHNLFLKRLQNFYFICISKRQAEIAKANKIKVYSIIHDGVDENKFKMHTRGGDSLLFVGRFIEEKGALSAIKVAKILNKKINMVGFFELSEKYIKTTNTIRNIIKNHSHLFKIDFRLREKAIVDKYQNSKLLLAPIQWEEPFGLVMIEAMACGTPVVALARGAIPEIIKDGQTGFIVNPSKDDIRGNWIIKKTGLAGLCEAVERIYAMPKDEYQRMRQTCRVRVERNFTIKIMISNYKKIYQKILQSK